MTDPHAVLNLKQARAHFLQAQRLVVPAPDPLSAIESVITVQTQYAASLPGALFARTKSYPRNWHEKALRNGFIVKSWTLRHTVQTQSAADHALLLAAMGSYWRGAFAKWYDKCEFFSNVQLIELEANILEVLAEKPHTRQQLHARIPELAKLPWAGWGLDVKGLAYLGAICFANNDGATQFRPHTLAKCELTQEEASKELARRYFRSYGPATLQDFVYWSSMPAVQAKAAVTAIKHELTSVTVEGLKGQRFLVGDPVAATPKGVRLLPKFDALALAHRDKGLFFSAITAKRVFRPAGQIEALVLAGDEVVGTWRIKKTATSGEVTVEAFKRLGPRVLGRIEKEAARMARPFGLKKIALNVQP